MASSGDRWVVPLLVATLVIVLVLFGQLLRTLRSHEALVESTLRDFAAFGAERVATELDEAYTAIFLDGVATARAAHYRWVANPDAATRAPPVPDGLPDHAIATFFSIEEEGSAGAPPSAADSPADRDTSSVSSPSLASHGPAPDADTRHWIVDGIVSHRHAYREQAPYAVLRSVEPTAVVYRREEAYGRESVYGFLIDVTAPIDLLRRVAETTDLLPSGLSGSDDLADLLTVSVHLAPGRPALYVRAPRADGSSLGGDAVEIAANSEARESDDPQAWAFAAKAGRLAVRARIDRGRATPILSNDVSKATLPLLWVLAILTGGLIYLAILLQRRSSRLVSLRESFIANVSHDLRTPIAQIRMFSETLRLERLEDPTERERALEIIQRQTEVLEDLVDNLLHASNSGAPLHPVDTRVDDLAADVVEALVPSARERGCAVELLQSRPVSAVVDPTAVTRILLNLVDNAIRHGADDGTVRVSVIRDGADTVVLTVDDDGPGIPEADRDRVLGRFERLERSEAGPATGAGIGLSVVCSLARRHGGGIRIETSPMGGARVVVHLATSASGSAETGAGASAVTGTANGAPS